MLLCTDDFIYVLHHWQYIMTTQTICLLFLVKTLITCLRVTYFFCSNILFLALCYVIPSNYYHNNKHISIAPQSRNIRGAGSRQCATEKREERKPGSRVMSLA